MAVVSLADLAERLATSASGSIVRKTEARDLRELAERVRPTTLAGERVIPVREDLARLFEDAITQFLVDRGGYVAGKRGIGQQGPAEFDATSGIDTAELFAFIGQTQADEWAKLIALHGGDPNVAGRIELAVLG